MIVLARISEEIGNKNAYPHNSDRHGTNLLFNEHVEVILIVGPGLCVCKQPTAFLWHASSLFTVSPATFGSDNARRVQHTANRVCGSCILDCWGRLECRCAYVVLKSCCCWAGQFYWGFGLFSCGIGSSESVVFVGEVLASYIDLWVFIVSTAPPGLPGYQYHTPEQNVMS